MIQINGPANTGNIGRIRPCLTRGYCLCEPTLELSPKSSVRLNLEKRSLNFCLSAIVGCYVKRTIKILKLFHAHLGNGLSDG
jgi:tRNA(Leu) C34 or U34 (ribose-2'-O)-methylase TrmL